MMEENVHCAACGEETTVEESADIHRRFRYPHDLIVCSDDCFFEVYELEFCEECGELTYLCNGAYYDNMFLCEYCYNEVTDSSIDHYDAEMCCEEYDSFTLGFELEYQFASTDDKISCYNEAKKSLDLPTGFELKEDCSLTRGMEIATGTLPYERRKTYAQRICEIFSRYALEDNSGAGFHIHISRKEFDDEHHITKLAVLFSILYEQLIEFGKRSSYDASEWARCNFDDDEVNHMSLEELTERFKNRLVRSRYYAVSHYPSMHTVEIRLFGSTFEHERICALIDFCYSAVEFTRDNDLEVIRNVRNIHDVMGAYITPEAEKVFAAA